VRHERFAVVLLLSTAAVLVGATGCNGDKPASAPKTEVAAPARCPGPDLASDTVSGCVCGAALVKVLIDLKPEKDRCVAEVTPASVCVAAGGVVRFRVQNGCAALGDSDRPALEITKPVFKRPLTTRAAPTGLPELFQNCVLRVQRIDRAASHVVLCDIAADAYEGFYKYGLTGQVVPLDPDVEVRPGRK
jgi:hypothetical protein